MKFDIYGSIRAIIREMDCGKLPSVRAFSEAVKSAYAGDEPASAMLTALKRVRDCEWVGPAEFLAEESWFDEDGQPITFDAALCNLIELAIKKGSS